MYICKYLLCNNIAFLKICNHGFLMIHNVHFVYKNITSVKFQRWKSKKLQRSCRQRGRGLCKPCYLFFSYNIYYISEWPDRLPPRYCLNSLCWPVTAFWALQRLFVAAVLEWIMMKMSSIVQSYWTGKLLCQINIPDGSINKANLKVTIQQTNVC